MCFNVIVSDIIKQQSSQNQQLQAVYVKEFLRISQSNYIFYTILICMNFYTDGRPEDDRSMVEYVTVELM